MLSLFIKKKKTTKQSKPKIRESLYRASAPHKIPLCMYGADCHKGDDEHIRNYAHPVSLYVINCENGHNCEKIENFEHIWRYRHNIVKLSE